MNKMFVMQELNVNGAGAGGGNTPPPNINANQVVPSLVTEGGNKSPITLPEKWQTFLPDDLKNEPSIQNYQDLPALVKSFVNAQKAVGADKVVIPSKHATEKDWSDFYKKVGAVPDAFDKYDVKTPEIFKQDESGINNLKKAAFEAGVNPKAFQKLIDTYGEDLKGQILKNQENIKAQTEKGVQELKAEWGVKYDENIKKAQAAVNKFGDDSLKKFLDSTGLGNNPSLIKAFKNMGESLNEDKIHGGGGNKPSGLYTPGEALIKANDILANADHPYRNREHPNHKAAVDEVKGLFEMAYPEGS